MFARLVGRPQQAVTIDMENSALQQAFERMTREELTSYAETGMLPKWFDTEATSGKRFSNANSPAPWDYPLGSSESRAAARLAVHDPELEALKAQPGVTKVIRVGQFLVVVEHIGRRQDGKAIE